MLTTSSLAPMQNQQQNQNQQFDPDLAKFVTEHILNNLSEQARETYEFACDGALRVNQALALAHNANTNSLNAFENTKKIAAKINEFSDEFDKKMEDATLCMQEAASAARRMDETVQQKGDVALTKLNEEYDRLCAALSDESEKIETLKASLASQQREHDLKNKFELEKMTIDEKHKRGIYEMEEKLRWKAFVEAEGVKWDKIREILSDSKILFKIAMALSAVSLAFYSFKYGIPVLIDYFSKPTVISETSQRGWLDWGKTQQYITLEDLIFPPQLERQLFELARRIKTATMYNENLPNILLSGDPGTGKTALAKALAYYSDLDYALTSASEFAKIKDLSQATDELRKLLNWAQKNNKGLIIFIDEIDSIFKDRTLPQTTERDRQFANLFFSLIDNTSQKNLMFIFATNHPFMLDDALTNRIGISLQFPLPEAKEREKILSMYLKKFAEENDNALVTLLPDVIQTIPHYAKQLEGLSPRSIKGIAEEMIIAARRNDFKQLTADGAQAVITQAKETLAHITAWKHERKEWASA